MVSPLLSPRTRFSRRILLSSLAGLAVIGSTSILAVALTAQKHPQTHSASIPTHTPTPVPTRSAALVTYRGHQSAVFSAVWSPDDQFIASAGGDIHTRLGDTGVHIWNALTDNDALPPYLGHAKLVRMVAWSPNRLQIASASEDGTVEVWNAAPDTNPLPPYTAHRDQVCAVAWSPDSAYIASAGGNILAESKAALPQGDTSVHIWTPSTLQDTIYPGHSHLVKAVAWSPDGKLVASADISGIVNIWDPGTRTTLQVLHHKAEVGSLAWSPDSKYIVTGGYNSDDNVKIWDTSTGHNIYRFPGAPRDQVYTVAWSPDGLHIAAGYQNNEVKVWNYNSSKNIGTQILTYIGHTAPVMSVQWANDSQRIASGGFDKTVQIWTIS